MLRGTAGQVLVNAALPAGLRNYQRVLDKKGTQALLQELAAKHPEQYADVLHDLHRLAAKATYYTGSNSFGLRHLRSAASAVRLLQELEQKVLAVYQDAKLSPEQKHARALQIASEYQAPLEKSVYDESVAESNPLALQVISGARGNKTNLRSLRGADLTYVDHRDRPISVPVLHSYSQGLRPYEYFAGAFGARKGVIDTKLSVADAGFASKQFNQLTHRLMVTAHDDPPTDDTPRGLPVAVDDPDNAGAFLAADTGGYKRNTLLTPRILSDLKGQGLEHILVRSPAVTGPSDGGVYAMDVGVREKGRVAPIGDFVGLTASQSLAEPLTQATLCLAEGTLVRMADQTARAIETIKPGDRVLAADRLGRPFATAVINVYNNGPRECLQYDFLDAEYFPSQVACTADHKFLLWREEQTVIAPLGETPVGLPVACAIGGLQRTLSVVQPAGLLPTYDLEIDTADHLFVLACGLIVSNSSKHSGGVAGAGRSANAFEMANQLVQVPKVFQGGATHSRVDGIVQTVQAAPQGGYHVTVGGEKHYVPQGFPVIVKPGDPTEAGDVLSEGLPNPAEIVKYKGIGEGRRYWIGAFHDLFKRSGITANRRNVELVARGLINHVRLTDEYGHHVPDDVMPYTSLEHSWQPREGHRVTDPRQALGQYLEKPVLHYSIGTRIRPSVVKQLQQFGVKQIAVHAEPPPFEPEMIRGMESLSHDPDWATRFLGSYVKKNFLKGVHRGDYSDERGTSYVPSLIRAVDFDKFPPVQGYENPLPIPAAPRKNSIMDGLQLPSQTSH